MSKVAILLANGFEEIEALSIIDILRRAQIEVIIAGVGGTDITGAHQVKVIADTLIEKIQNETFDMIILPGGEPGTTNLENNPQVAAMIQRQAQSGQWVSAICAAPRVLDKAGLLKGKQATSYPGTKPSMTTCVYLEDNVVRDGKIITSRGPATAMEFAYKLVECLTSKEIANRLKEAMLFTGSLART